MIELGERLTGPAGTATQVHYTLERSDPLDWNAAIAFWWLDCPGQTPFWRYYGLNVIHLRALVGVKPAHIRVPGATHEVLLAAYNPEANPSITDRRTWQHLTPINLQEQIELPSDDEAVALARQCARAVVNGVLWAEPPLSGQVEPWRTTLIKTAAHARGEVHAP